MYLYYLLDNGAGVPYEIYRGKSGLPFNESQLERAKKDGSWSSADVRPFLNLWFKGDFDADDGKISEDRAMSLLKDWHANNWPGRP